MTTKPALLAILKEAPEPRIEKIGPYWQIAFAWLSGAETDAKAEALARHLLARWKAEKPFHAEPEPVEIPAFLKADEPVIDPRDAEIAALRAQIVAAQQPKPDGPNWIGDHEPPAEFSDIIGYYDTPAEAHEKLQKLFMEAKQSEEIARSYGGASGIFNGKTAMEWLRKAERIESGINWNRGRLSGTI